MVVWIKEISAAARGENLHAEINYGELYELLGLSEEDEPSVSDISRAYRRAALKAHPDKGGNMAQACICNALHGRFSLLNDTMIPSLVQGDSERISTDYSEN